MSRCSRWQSEVIILGFETNMLAESRMALPEIPSVLATLLAFLRFGAWAQDEAQCIRRRVLAAMAVAMKGTSVLVAPVFPLVILLAQGGSNSRAIERT